MFYVKVPIHYLSKDHPRFESHKAEIIECLANEGCFPGWSVNYVELAKLEITEEENE